MHFVWVDMPPLYFLTIILEIQRLIYIVNLQVALSILEYGPLVQIYSYTLS